MRRLNQKEREFCKIIRTHNILSENVIEKICQIELDGQKLSLDVGKREMKVITGNKIKPNLSKMPDGVIAVNDFADHKKILQTIMSSIKLIELLESEGLIYLFKNRKEQRWYEIGAKNNTRITHMLIPMYTDQRIFDSLIKYLQSGIVTTAEFDLFVENDFKTQKEIYDMKQLNAAIGNTAISAISALVAAMALFFSLLVQIWTVLRTQ